MRAFSSQLSVPTVTIASGAFPLYQTISSLWPCPCHRLRGHSCHKCKPGNGLPVLFPEAHAHTSRLSLAQDHNFHSTRLCVCAYNFITEPTAVAGNNVTFVEFLTSPSSRPSPRGEPTSQMEKVLVLITFNRHNVEKKKVFHGLLRRQIDAADAAAEEITSIERGVAAAVDAVKLIGEHMRARKG